MSDVVTTELMEKVRRIEIRTRRTNSAVGNDIPGKGIRRSAIHQRQYQHMVKYLLAHLHIPYNQLPTSR